MNITRKNYEIWAIDYLEGKLSTSDSAIFMAFLAENSDLADELDLIRDAIEIPDLNAPLVDFNYLKKEYLKIPITADCFEEFCIAYHEGDLDINSQQNLIEYIGADPNKKNLFNTYKLIKVQANEFLVFQGKAELKKPIITTLYSNSRRVLQIISTIAAAILIFILLNYNNKYQLNSINTSRYSNHLSDLNIKSDSIITLNKIHNTSINKVDITRNISMNLQNIVRKKQNNIHISAVDTSCWEDPFIPATRIDISSIQNTLNMPALLPTHYAVKESHISDEKQSFPRKAISNILVLSKSKLFKPKRLTLDAMLRRSVAGINQVVETELKYNSEVDDEGKIIAFALSSERFNITRKIKSN